MCVCVCVIPSPIDSTFRNISKHSPSRTYMCVYVCINWRWYSGIYTTL